MHFTNFQECVNLLQIGIFLNIVLLGSMCKLNIKYTMHTSLCITYNVFNAYKQIMLYFIFQLQRRSSVRDCMMHGSDSVRREVLYNILIEFGVPVELVRMIKMCLNET
jgi:hypothetical protein